MLHRHARDRRLPNETVAMQEVGRCEFRVGREGCVGARAKALIRFTAHVVAEIRKGMTIVIASQDELLHAQIRVDGPDL